MRTLEQIRAVSAIGLRGLPQRATTSLVVVVGIAGVVAVLLSVLALSTGLSGALTATGRSDRAIILHAQSTDEDGSTLAAENIPNILDAPGIARGRDGKPLASTEALATVNVLRGDTGRLGALTLRGVSPDAFELRPELHLVAGRMFRSGVRELIAGRAAQQRFRGLGVGQHILFDSTDWLVVGAFDSGGGAHDSELLADADTVQSVYQRTAFNSVTVKLAGPGALDTLRAALTKDPTLSVTVNSETAYYEQQSHTFAAVLALIATVVGVIMAIGAVFAALNTMYSAVSTRAVEIATLRAIGFGPVAVVISVIAEALLLALAGAVLGAAVAWAVFDGNTVSTIAGGGGVAQVVFRLHIGAPLFVTGIVWACVVGLIGGLAPAVRAARIPVATALRAI
ncbi:MAG TPA: ABC transporter permease [Steroidobacteraceae bacterium]|nr:ABC transporter permease [Steroidobacteraceae bacterium]